MTDDGATGHFCTGQGCVKLKRMQETLEVLEAEIEDLMEYIKESGHYSRWISKKNELKKELLDL